MKSSQGSGASEHVGSGRKRTSRPIGQKDSSRLDDDDGNRIEAELVLKLPDSAGPDRVKAVLRENGVDPGRAHNLASNHLLTPAMVRNGIAKVEPRLAGIHNAGGYLGNLLDDEITKARTAEREREEQAFDAEQQRLVEAEASIDTVSNTELQQVIDGIESLKGLSPDEVRTNPVFRAVVAGRLNWQQK